MFIKILKSSILKVGGGGLEHYVATLSSIVQALEEPKHVFAYRLKPVRSRPCC